MVRLRAVAAAFVLVPASLATAGIRPTGPYSGIVIFDRWDSCHLYSGVYLMDISQKVKEQLRPNRNLPVTIFAEEVVQPVNPGDGLITKLRVLGPAPETAFYPPVPVLDGINILAMPDFRPRDGNRIVMELRNTGPLAREVDLNSWAPTLFSKRSQPPCFFSDPGDGPSYAVVTRMDIALLRSGPADEQCVINNAPHIATLSIAPDVSLPPRLTLGPGEEITAPLLLNLPPGEYQFISGYGGGVHESRPLSSEPISFDVDSRRHAHPIPGR